MLLRRLSTICVLTVSACVLAACASQKPTATASSKRSKEYFAESEYGVKASPRVSNLRSNLPRGGGRDQLGQPYKVKGRWYEPKEDPNYRKAGAASWYGDAFHGRLTANGEIYDMTHLTAAHPTMPLPSYARVTNKANGSSVIVRVNDRGPFAEGRIIDLSRRAAEMLDYTHAGVARVEVEYLGRAPLHGQDDAFLLASYRPGGGAPDPSDGLPTGVMIAMNGPTPTSAPRETAAFPAQPAATPQAQSPIIDLVLPETGPIAPSRPDVGLASLDLPEPGLLSAYADERVKRAAQAVNAFAESRLESGALTQALSERFSPVAPAIAAGQEYVAVGTYRNRAEADAIADALRMAGEIRISNDGDGYAVSLLSDGRLEADAMLRAAWAAGAGDAMTVRD